MEYSWNQIVLKELSFGCHLLLVRWWSRLSLAILGDDLFLYCCMERDIIRISSKGVLNLGYGH